MDDNRYKSWAIHPSVHLPGHHLSKNTSYTKLSLLTPPEELRWIPKLMVWNMYLLLIWLFSVSMLNFWGVFVCFLDFTHL